MANIVNQYGQVKLGVRYTLAPLTSSYLLDMYSGASAAYSLRKLRTAYTGAAIRVRRSSDNTTLDVGFNANGELDTTALLAFVGAGNGFVSIWYDQSENSRNQAQVASASQPQIVSGGNLITSNGKPSLQFDGVDDYLINFNTVFSGEDVVISTINTVDILTSRYNELISMANSVTGTGLEVFVPFRMETTQYGTIKRDNIGTIKTANFGTSAAGLQLLTSYSSGTTENARKNGTLILNAANVNVGNITINNIAIGALVRNTPGGFAHMKSMEIIVYPTNQSTNISSIESNINSFYSIYATDVDAQAFITAAAITNTTQQTAITTLVTDLKTANIWTKMKAIYPFVGGTAAQHRFNLKDPRALDAAYYLTFFGGGTHSATGYLPNGNSYANTKLNPRTALGATSAHFSYYSRNATTSTSSNYVMGADDASGFNALILRNNSKYFRYTINNSAFEDAGLLTTSSTSGFFIGNQDGTNVKLFRNNTNIAQNTATDPKQEKVNLPIFIGADNNNGSAADYTTAESAFASLGDGLTDTEATALYTAVQKYQTTLNRQV